MEVLLGCILAYVQDTPGCARCSRAVHAILYSELKLSEEPPVNAFGQVLGNSVIEETAEPPVVMGTTGL